MYKLKERKGFTLAELLIVVAIIAVLVAVAIPVFTAQLEKAAEAADLANIRSAYAEATAELLTGSASSVEKSTPKAQSTGKFEKADTTGLTWASGISTFEVTKGSPIKVTVAIDGAGSQTVTLAK